jgi:hypothetical protein
LSRYFCPRNYFSRPAHQHSQDLGRLWLKLYGHTVAAQFSAAEIQLKAVKA